MLNGILDYINFYNYFSMKTETIEKYLKDKGFKKEFPDKEMDPKFYWFIKYIKHNFFINLNINVDFREKRITVFCDEVSNYVGKDGYGEVCIINKSFVGLGETGTMELIYRILNLFN